MILTALVSSEILAQRLNDAYWIVFDCRHELADPGRGRTDYLKSHIPGACFLHLDDDLSAPKTGRNGRHPLPDPDTLMDKLGRAGVDSRKQVVAYDAQGGMVAARLWWLLRALGHLPVAVLDGGWNQWISEGRAHSRGVQPVFPRQPRRERALQDARGAQRGVRYRARSHARGKCRELLRLRSFRLPQSPRDGGRRPARGASVSRLLERVVRRSLAAGRIGGTESAGALRSDGSPVACRCSPRRARPVRVVRRRRLCADSRRGGTLELDPQSHFPGVARRRDRVRRRRGPARIHLPADPLGGHAAGHRARGAQL